MIKKRFSAGLIFFLLLAETLSAQQNFLTHSELLDGWHLLFDGRTLNGWHTYAKSSVDGLWDIQDGSLHVKGSRTPDILNDQEDLVTNESYGEFDLKLEWKLAPGGNSGVMFHVQENAGISPTWTGPEMQILDDQGNPDHAEKHRSGSLFSLIAAVPGSTNPGGEWNESELYIHNGLIKITQNGTVVVSQTFDESSWRNLIAGSPFQRFENFGLYPTGKISLQFRGDELWIRKIRIRTFGVDANSPFGSKAQQPIISDAKSPEASDIHAPIVSNDRDQIDNTQIEDVDGHSYDELLLGKQVWLKENLNVSHFNNGDEIPEAESADAWSQAALNHQPAWCYPYPSSDNPDKYGKFYNWYAVNDKRGLAPKGWHIAHNNEWDILLNYLNDFNFNDVGIHHAVYAMKGTFGWDFGGNGGNESDFTALPGGSRTEFGWAAYMGRNADWWTGSDNQNNNDSAVFYEMRYIDNDWNSNDAPKGKGFNVRCVKN